MCWFHVKFNILKHKLLIPNDLYKEVENDVSTLHFSKSRLELENLKTKILKKWKKQN